MENLDTVFKDKKLEDLVVAVPVKESTLLEPTLAEKKAILAGLVEGKSYKEIRKSVRRVDMDGEKQVSAKGFSYGQIKEIDMARLAKIAELTAPEVVE